MRPRSIRLTNPWAGAVCFSFATMVSTLAPSFAAAQNTEIAYSQEQAATYHRWKNAIDEFNAQDEKTPAKMGGVLFVGSSTIRMWGHLNQDFSSIPVVMNRGFGGSTMNDCSHLVRDLVTRYKPRQVLVYAGDNDLAQGRTPEQVLTSFQTFVGVVRQELPGAQLAYISIKPSPSRETLLPKIRQANALLSNYVGTLENAKYIDIFTPMLDADGRPRQELFLPDMLHMNTNGYALWQGVIGDYLASAPAPVLVSSTDVLNSAAKK